MKKLLAIIAVLFVMAAIPKVIDAAEQPCVWKWFCGHRCLVCDAYDYVIWDEIYCLPIED